MPGIDQWEWEKLTQKANLLDDILGVIDRYKEGMPFRITRIDTRKGCPPPEPVDFPNRAEGTSSDDED